MSMDESIKERWGEWLLAHEDEQGEGALCRENADGKLEFCCLGGLSELAVADGIITRTFSEVTRRYSYGLGDADGEGNWSDLVLPWAVVRWAGLPGENPEVTGPGGHRSGSLAFFNDHGVSFRDIWDLIREQL